MSLTVVTTIRPARPEDVPAVVAMVHELAEYERAPEQCHLTDEQLTAALFGAARRRSSGTSRSTRDDEPFGFALWFLNFSTWDGVHGIYLEDLYVRPAARGTGAGRLLLATLAGICVERGYRRLEWWMLDWNPAAGFYAAIGADADGRMGAVPARPAHALHRARRARDDRAARVRATDRVESPTGGMRRDSTDRPAGDRRRRRAPHRARRRRLPRRAPHRHRRSRGPAEFALDEIEDLRIAVDEACAMLLAIATRDAELECRFAVTDDALTVEVTVPTVRGAHAARRVVVRLEGAHRADHRRRRADAADGRATISLLTRRAAGY